jgi:hypothetical protein
MTWLGGGFRGVLGRPDCWRADGDGDVDLLADQFGGEARKKVIFAICVPALEDDIAPLHVSEFTERLCDYLEGRQSRASFDK